MAQQVDFKEKIAIVTGGAQGIGRCISCFQAYTADGLSSFLQNYGIRLWV